MTFKNLKTGQTIESNLTLFAAQEILKKITNPTDFQKSMGKCQNPTLVQLFWIHHLANQALRPPTVGEYIKIVELFNKAKTHLKKPKVTFEMEGNTICLSAAPSTGNNPGFIYLKGNGEYLGKITPQGIFLAGPLCSQDIKNLMQDFNADILTYAAEYGKKTGTCCLCGRYLENEISVSLGIGPVCRAGWGL